MLAATALVGLTLAGLSIGLPTGRAQNETPQFVPAFEYSDTIRQQLARLEKLRTQKLWDQWLASYQRMVDEHPDGVAPRDDEFMVGLRYSLHKQLGELPPAVRERYRALYDKPARELYDTALRAGDARRMREVVGRYPHSSVGRDAWLWLGNQALEAGNVSMAHAAYARVVNAPRPPANSLIRMAWCAQRLGRLAEARGLLRRLGKEFGGEAVRLRGKQITGAEAARELEAALPKTAPAPAAEWNSFGGPDGWRRMTGAPAFPLELAWKYAYPIVTQKDSRAVYRQVIIGSQYGSNSARFGYLDFPVRAGQRLWLQGPKNVVALDAKTGKTVWTQADFKLAPEQLPPMPRGRAALGLPYYTGGRSFQAAPVRSGRWLISRIPATGPAQVQTRSRRYRRMPLNYALMATDAETGAILWKRLSASDPPSSFFNAPAVYENTLLTGAGSMLAGITEYRAVAMEAGTGEELWSTYLGGGSDPLLAADGSPPVVRDGLVWIESTLYTLNALDLVTGEIRYIYHYTPREQISLPGSRRYRAVPNEPISLLAGGTGPLVFAPRWGQEVVGIDPAEGRLLWAAPRGYGIAVVGADDQRAYVAGSTLQAYDLQTGARLWVWDPESASSNVGYPALVEDRLYVVVESRLEVRSAADGRRLESFDLQPLLGESPGYTSLLATPDLLLIGTREGMFALRHKSPAP